MYYGMYLCVYAHMYVSMYACALLCACVGGPELIADVSLSLSNLFLSQSLSAEPRAH